MQTLDWLIVGAYFVLSAVVGLWYTRRAGKNVSEFFVSGRSLPWWLAGTSMVATTFAADTPLAVTGMVAANGVAGNWLWWNMVMSGILTVFFYAHLWRRAEVLTDVEFTELRYSGKPAAYLRIFRALYMALPINLIIMGWVNLAMLQILRVVLGIDPVTAVIAMFAVTMVYSVFSGLWGVVVTDFIQFIIAMGGSIVLAWYAVREVGGIDAEGSCGEERGTGRSEVAASSVRVGLDEAPGPDGQVQIPIAIQLPEVQGPGPGHDHRFRMGQSAISGVR